MRTSAIVLLLPVVILGSPRAAQPQNAERGAPLPTAQATAPIDLTGYWVSFVTEEWRYRMVTPPKGDYAGVPMTAAARKTAAAWDPAADEAAGNACRAYGVGGIMRVPGRLRITWEDGDTLRIDTDAGTQTRRLHFGRVRSPAVRPTWQGYSVARWEQPPQPQVRDQAVWSRGGSLVVATANMRSGYLRRNGVPYSDQATLTEYFDIVSLPDEGRLIVVTSVVNDPVYLEQPFVVTSHFKKEKDGSRWDPTSCTARW